MAEPKNDGQECEEREAMQAKRKPDLIAVAENNEASVKKQKSESPDGDDSSPIAEGKQITLEDYEDEDEEDEYYEETDSSDEDDDDDEDSDEEEEEDGAGDKDEKSNGKAPVDRKGKGILIEETKSDSDDDSDLVEDPLAEVDLDNILPTKTRGGGFRRSGISISDNAGNNHSSKSNDN